MGMVAPHHPTPEADLKAAEERLEACANDLICNAENLAADAEIDSKLGTQDAEFYLNIAAERKQWAADLRLVLAQLAAYREALKPFAEAYDAATLAFPSPHNYADWLSMMRHLPNSKDFAAASEAIGWKPRRAAQALAASKGEG